MTSKSARARAAASPWYRARGSATNGSPWYHPPPTYQADPRVRQAWNRRPRATAPGVPSVERTRERLQRQANRLDYLRGYRADVRRRVGPLRAQVYAVATRAAASPELADALRSARRDLADDVAHQAKVEREMQRLRQSLRRTGQTYALQKARRAVTDQLALAPPNAGKGFPGGAQYRAAAGRFRRAASGGA